jgi:hypothetical protein
MSPSLDRVLLALRACGPDQVRADPERTGCWLAYCPACASHLMGARRLTVAATKGGASVSMNCTLGCRPTTIAAALRFAEHRYATRPALTDWGLDAPRFAADIAAAAIAEHRELQRIVRALEREAAA